MTASTLSSPTHNDFYYQSRPTLGVKTRPGAQAQRHPRLQSGTGRLSQPLRCGPSRRHQRRGGIPIPTAATFARPKSGRPPATRTVISPTGWIGRLLRQRLRGLRPDRRHQHRRPRLPQAFSSHNPTGISLQNPGQLPLHGRGPERRRGNGLPQHVRRLARRRPCRRRRGRAASACSAAPSRSTTARARSTFSSAPRWTRRSARTKIRDIAGKVEEPCDLSRRRPGQQSQARRTAHRRRPAHAASSICRRAATTPTPTSAAPRTRGSRNWPTRSRPSPRT